MQTDSRIILGLLAGAAVGAIAGILFAPDRGSETRKRISKATSDMGGNLKNKFSRMKGKARERYSEVRGGMEDVEERAVPGYE
jgi:gas vesicle protein